MPEHTPAPTPSRGVYGFVMYLSFKIFFLLYVIWAIIPEEWFINIGLTYLPSRYWAVTVPVFLLTFLTTFAFVIYPSLGLVMTPNVDDIRTIKANPLKELSKSSSNVDLNTEGNTICCKENKKCKRKQFENSYNEKFLKNCIPTLQDLDICEVSKELYL